MQLRQVRELSARAATYVVSCVALSMSLFHLYTAFFGIYVSILQRSAHLGFALTLTFLVIPSIQGRGYRLGRLLDGVLVLTSTACFLYFVTNAHSIVSRYSFVDPLKATQIGVGVVSTVLVLEATRRAIGWTLPTLMVALLVYTLFGDELPGILGHREFDIVWVVEQLFFTTSGVFGIPLGVASTFIFLFILLGKFLELFGGGQFFIDLAMATMGKYRGGPAKIAVVASSLLGTISGSAVANTTTTGAFTIPLMKKTGYPSDFAGAVEAVASTGGQLAPPLMGAAAFIIAATLGVPYTEVALAAVIPAVLYYVCLYTQVHFRAVRENLEGLPVGALPDIKEVLKGGILFFVPLVVIVYMLVQGYSPMRAGLFTIVSVLIVAAVSPRGQFTLLACVRALDLGARAAIETSIACAAAGVLIGLVSLTGIGLEFSSVIVKISGGNLALTLLFTMVCSIVLGMGLPTVAAYIIQVPLTIPAITEMGVPAIAAHLFVFYFACISSITPPVALAAFAGAGIAGSDPMRTGWVAARLGLAAFIVPYLFVYRTPVLWTGSWVDIGLTFITSVVAIYAIGASAEGWLTKRMNIFGRIVLLGCGLLLVVPDVVVNSMGFGGLMGIYVVNRRVRGLGVQV